LNVIFGGYQTTQAQSSDFNNQATQTPWPINYGIALAFNAGDNRTGPTQGTDDNNREGDCIWTTGMHIKGVIEPTTGSSVVTSDVVRMMIVYDKQPNQAVMPLLSDETGLGVLDTASTGGGANTPSMAQRNLISKKRYKVIYDKTWCLQMNSTTDTNANRYCIDELLKFKKGYKTVFAHRPGVGTALIADVDYGSITCFLIGSRVYNNTIITSTTWEFTGSIRTYFNSTG